MYTLNWWFSDSTMPKNHMETFLKEFPDSGLDIQVLYIKVEATNLHF